MARIMHGASTDTVKHEIGTTQKLKPKKQGVLTPVKLLAAASSLFVQDRPHQREPLNIQSSSAQTVKTNKKAEAMQGHVAKALVGIWVERRPLRASVLTRPTYIACGV